AALDLNRDGRVDLAVANANSNNVSILLGTGTGDFGTAVNFPVGDGSRSLAVGDFTGDGTPDLAVANVFSNSVSILLNTCARTCLASSLGAEGDVNGGGVARAATGGD